MQWNQNGKMDGSKEDIKIIGRQIPAPAMVNEGSERRSTNVTLPGRCDICGMKDGFKENNLQQCKSCGIYVHETCYGFVGEEGQKLPNWECKACEAVGKSFLGKSYGADKAVSILQSERPRECVLCSIDTGVHAMHMVYDKAGKEGMPLVLPAKRKDAKKPARPQRLAWVHSLCSFFICSNPSTQGCIFGCTKNGLYDGAESEESSFPSLSGIDSTSSSDFYDNQSVSSSSDDEESKKGDPSLPLRTNNTNNADKVKLKKESSTDPSTNNSNQNDDDDDGLDDMHHFVFADEDPWKQIINDHRQLKCHICGENDKRKNVLRIPVQCHAGDESEFEEFKGCHQNLSGKESCCKAMHVGCARWGLNKSGEKLINQHVYFYPGKHNDPETSHKAKSYDEPIVGIFCSPHAKDIKNRKKKVKEIETEVISPVRGRPKVEDYQELPADWEEKNLSGSPKHEQNEVSMKVSSTTTNTTKSNFSETINQMKKNETESSETRHRNISNSAEKDHATKTASDNATKTKNYITSEYHQRKKIIEDAVEEMIAEAKKSINRAQGSYTSIEHAIGRLKAHMESHSALKAFEFKKAWEKVMQELEPILNKEKKSDLNYTTNENEEAMAQQIFVETENNNDHWTKLISKDLAKAKKKSEKNASKYNELLTKIKNYYLKNTGMSGPEFDSIWDKSIKLSESLKKATKKKSNNMEKISISSVETSNRWSFLFHGPQYSNEKTNEFFNKLDDLEII